MLLALGSSELKLTTLILRKYKKEKNSWAQYRPCPPPPPNLVNDDLVKISFNIINHYILLRLAPLN